MKGVLTTLLAAFVLPSAVNAESIEAQLARRQLPRIRTLEQNAQKFAQMEDYEAACDKQRQANYLVGYNFEGLQEVLSDIDMFAYRKLALKIEDTMCKLRDL